MDELLNLYLMEVNMSPNVTPIGDRFEHNAVFYEQLIYDAVKLVGAGSYFEVMAG
jgi:hypothetical protein